ncbi:MAG: TetR/AcrR family transcriptional regulator [Deltaproteobacteria bacterium]|nr:TetR/AcrR family transcriptional regulator [Deltaproteobacteria bacterium]
MGRSLPVLPLGSDAEGTGPSSAPPAERKDAARNRKKILEAAKKLMKSRGLDVVCMDELAAAAGVGKGTLYRRFTDKFALFRALLDEDEMVLQEAARARFGLPKTATPQQRLLATWCAFVDFVVDNADVLSAAETEVRSRAALAESAPYHWRHTELVRHLVGCQIEPVRASLIADAWLLTLAGDVVRRAIARSSVDEVRAAWRALPGGVDLSDLSERAAGEPT